jgi:hypothetical protein
VDTEGSRGRQLRILRAVAEEMGQAAMAKVTPVDTLELTRVIAVLWPAPKQAKNSHINIGE